MTLEADLGHLALHLGHFGPAASCPKLLNFGHETFEPHLGHLALHLAYLGPCFFMPKNIWHEKFWLS